MLPSLDLKKDHYLKNGVFHFQRVLLGVLGRVKKYSFYTVILIV
jgi:hypothetical protein